MSVLDPLSNALAAVVAAAHAGLTSLGADPASGTTWLLCIAAVVVAVRVLLLPLAIHGVRLAHASARARPQPAGADQALSQPQGRRQHARVHARNAAGSRPSTTCRGWASCRCWCSCRSGWRSTTWWPTPPPVCSVGAVSPELVASLGAATLLGVPLVERGYLGAGWTHLAVVAGLAGTAAVLSFVTQRYLVAPNTVLTDLPETMARAQQLMPAISAVGLLVAGGVVPAALLVYWVCNATWTLGQSAVVWRWFPTPGSPAALRAAAR